MALSRDEAIRLATLFVERQGWRTWWSLKRLAAHQAEHPEHGRDCWRVYNVPATTRPTITVVWLDTEIGNPVSASHFTPAGLEEWSDGIGS